MNYDYASRLVVAGLLLAAVLLAAGLFYSGLTVSVGWAVIAFFAGAAAMFWLIFNS